MKSIFTLIKKSGLDKSSIEQLEQFAQQVQENVKSVVQYIEPKLESGLEIIRKESEAVFNEMMKDMPSLDEVQEENKTFKPTMDMCFQDFLEFNGVTWNRYKLLSGKYNQKQMEEFMFNTNTLNWLNLSFSWTTEEGYDFWEALHYQWKECVNYAIDKDIQIIFNREENESPEYFTKKEVEETVVPKKERNESKLIGMGGLKLKTLTLQFFLEVHRVDTKKFMEYVIAEHGSFKDFKKEIIDNPIDWIDESFEWDSTVEGFDFWDNINTLWLAEVKEAVINDTKFKFGFKKEVLNFKKFLRLRDKLDLYKHCVKDGDYYLEELESFDSSEWLKSAFNWEETDVTYEVWYELNNQWLDEVSYAKDSDIKVVFGFKV